MIVGEFVQYPLKLAYAITIHKSQGQTYDAVCVDYTHNRAFAEGQTYVALSRCKTIENLYLKEGIRPEDIIVSQEAINYMNGHYNPQPVDTKIGYIEKNKETRRNPQIEWISENRIQVDVDDVIRPKKITGTRLPQILWGDRFGTPFTKWCEIMRVYERPFEDNKYTIAGKKIEPIQFEYARKQLAKQGRTFIAPKDRYGDDFVADFFETDEVFGGKWDYLIDEDGSVAAVLEMKTTQNKRATWTAQYPKEKSIQAALYAYLLGVDEYFMVTSYLNPSDYNAPENYVCTPLNTAITRIDFASHRDEFEKKVIMPMMEWWETHIVTGISPAYSTTNEADAQVIKELEKQRIMMETGAVESKDAYPSESSNEYRHDYHERYSCAELPRNMFD